MNVTRELLLPQDFGAFKSGTQDLVGGKAYFGTETGIFAYINLRTMTLNEFTTVRFGPPGADSQILGVVAVPEQQLAFGLAFAQGEYRVIGFSIPCKFIYD